MDELVRSGYPQTVISHLTSLGDAASGFRLAGGPSDLKQSRYVADQMRAAGLQNVRLEPIAVDVWNARGASVSVGGEVIAASQWAGVQPTPAEGITAPLVYVHGGLAEDYQAAGDVRGCVVIVDFLPSSFWVGVIGMEAKAHGAAGMILTSTRRDLGVFSDAESLASSSATYSPADSVPFVYVSRRDGGVLKGLLAGGPQIVTLRSHVEITMADEGGVAYNVIGELPGTAGADDLLVVGAHQDAFFRGAVDDASGVAGLLTMARAMRLGGYRPERTIVFVSHTAEEFGLTDSQYDWAIGSWRLMQAHPEWAGRVSAELEIDEIGYRSAPLWALNVPELGRWLCRSVDRPHARLWPQDWITSYSDQWAYTARGIPSIYFGNTSDTYDAAVNHTDRDTTGLLDYETLGGNVTTVFRAVRGLAYVNGELLPYRPEALVGDLAASVSSKELLDAGCDAAVTRRYQRSLSALMRAAVAYGERRRTVPKAHFASVNAGLLEVEMKLNRGLAALDWWDSTTYPHRAQLDDLLGVERGIRQCRMQHRRQALEALAGVSQTATGRHLDHQVYRRYLERFSDSYYRLGWAAWARLPLPLDVLPEYRLIESGEWTAAERGLIAHRRAAMAELGRDLAAMTPVLASAARRLDTLR